MKEIYVISTIGKTTHSVKGKDFEKIIGFFEVSGRPVTQFY